MTISVIGNTGSTGSKSSTGQVNNPNSNLGKLDFLEMLVTKLKYQDPTNPIKDESFIADMAQFSSLEQMQNMNTGFGTTNEALQALNKNILGLMIMQNTSQAASLIGKTVTVGYDVIDSVTGQTKKETLTGTVDSVKFVDGTPKLLIGGKQYDLTVVEEIKA